MVKRILLVLSMQLCMFVCHAQKPGSHAVEKVSFKIINKDKSEKVIQINWADLHISGNTGATKAVMSKIDKVLRENGVDCPPKREKVSDNIWLCGNGKKIKTDNTKLKALFSEAWEENE